MQFRDLKIIITGGTIDKIHDYVVEGLVFDPNGFSHIQKILEQGRCYFPTIEQLFLKDSAQFTDDDREKISDAISRADERAIVITHGTSTMETTARYLLNRIEGRTIVLTGAMRPFSFGVSDATFNLGSAIMAAQILEEGVWATMNGRLYPALSISKNASAGRFDI